MNAMKKNLLTLAILLASLTCAAQEHLSFKGIPIEGDMKEFCLKLSEKGFKKVGSEGTTALYTGDFTGREATVGVVAANDGKTVYTVYANFKPTKEWRELVDTYNYYKGLYTIKYGDPKKVVEKNPAYDDNLDDSNFSLMHELYEGLVTWTSQWEATGGDIELSIEKTSRAHEGLVIIRYRDARNEDIKITKDLEEI